MILTRFTLPVPLRRDALVAISLMIATIASVDLVVVPDVSIGFLYFFPLLFVATFLDVREILTFALICAVLKETFGPSAPAEEVVPQFLMTLMAYGATGLLIRQIDRSRYRAEIHAGVVAEQVRLREAAEQQLHSFVEGSPAAILTIDPEGRVLLANDAAHEMLGYESRTLSGELIDQFLPTVATLRQTSTTRRPVRTSIECTGYRRGGEAFLAQVWVSSFGSPGAAGLSVVLFDSSEELRTREEGKLQTLTTSARVIMGSFWHETRNFCTALRVTASSLRLIPGVVDSEEIIALSSLIEGLEKLAVAELRPESEQSYDCASLRAVLDHLRIVIEPWFQESKINIAWRLADNLPLVRGDQHAILQVFLNLARNASRVLKQSDNRRFMIEAVLEDAKVLVRFRNNGPPVPNPETLFKPFQPEAAGRGIGLYVSRAIMRSFGGDLRYDPVPHESCFTVVLERGGTWFLFSSQP